MLSSLNRVWDLTCVEPPSLNFANRAASMLEFQFRNYDVVALVWGRENDLSNVFVETCALHFELRKLDLESLALDIEGTCRHADNSPTDETGT